MFLQTRCTHDAHALGRWSQFRVGKDHCDRSRVIPKDHISLSYGGQYLTITTHTLLQLQQSLRNNPIRLQALCLQHPKNNRGSLQFIILLPKRTRNLKFSKGNVPHECTNQISFKQASISISHIIQISFYKGTKNKPKYKMQQKEENTQNVGIPFQRQLFLQT